MFVLDADYRKAPEHPFPLPLQDVEDVLRWVGTSSPGRLIDTQKVALSGFSAGAELALVASSVLRTTLLRDVELDIKAVVAFYPETDLSLPLGEKKVVQDPVRPRQGWTVDFFHECYVPDVRDRADPAVSPSKAGEGEFPEWVVMVTCGGDVFSTEALELAGRLRDWRGRNGGVEGEEKGGIVVRNLEGMAHGFDKGCERGTREWEVREEVYGDVVGVLKGVFGEGER